MPRFSIPAGFMDARRLPVPARRNPFGIPSNPVRGGGRMMPNIRMPKLRGRGKPMATNNDMIQKLLRKK